MPPVRAVLFDFGGTLYDYLTLAPAEYESLVELARAAGVEADPSAFLHCHRQALRRVFHAYLPQPFYLHRDLFRDAVVGMLEDLGASAAAMHLEGYRSAQWQRQARDFVLREGVVDTLRALRARGVHLGIVSNIDEDQLQHLLEVARIGPCFDSALSSERAGSCKPDPGIFAAALQRAHCKPQEALFVGDTIAQDIAGANRAGMRSVLLWHRDDRDPPTDGPRPHHIIRRIPDLLELV